MRSYIVAFVSLVLVSAITFGARGLLRRTNREIWKSSVVDKTALFLPYFSYVLLALLTAGIRLQLSWLTPFASAGVAIVSIISLILLVTLPFSLVTNYLSGKLPAGKNKKPQPTDPSRRLFLKTAAASIPIVATSATSKGFAGAFKDVHFPEVDFEFTNLPAEFDGFRILHLSDLHLGYYFNLADLERLLDNFSAKPVDTVLITGDVADDLSQLGDALRLVDQLPSTYPKFVSIGNHEYFRGINDVRRIMDAGPLQLLISSGHHLSLNGKKIYIAGADDPVTMRRDILGFLKTTTEKAVAGTDPDTFKILMSHRPRALDVADPLNVDLILSGHTHGGQMGANGRSVFEEMMKERYMWGKYKKGSSRLYTSAGVGHWFPFRLGCPAEAPVITLRKV